MQSVSESYNPYAPERWTTAKVTFELIDVDAADVATVNATSEAAISKLSQSRNKMTSMSKKIATMEPKYFFLDGSFTLPDKTYNDEVGWWSNEISDSNGVLAIPQVLEFVFTSDQSSKGFTIVFDDKSNEYAKDFVVETYNATGTMIGQVTILNNTKNTCVIDLPSLNYRKVKVTLTKTANPYRRVRVCEFVFGFLQHFYDDDISKINLLYETSHLSENLPSNQLTLTINNTDRQYNVINPSGVYKFLQQGQGLNVQIGIGSTNDFEMINMGRFYFDSATAENNSMTAQIVAHDRFYLLNETKCRIGTTGTWNVSSAVAAVIADSGLSINPVIPSSIANRIVNKCIPKGVSHREAIRLIAQAGKCYCYFNRNDELIFKDFAEGTVTDTFNNDNLFKLPKVSDAGRINKVELTVKNEYAGTEVIYTSTNKTADETDRTKSIINPLAASQEVANWLLTMAQKNVGYILEERGNPAREIGDTVKIYDSYNENRNAIVTKEQFDYDGTLKGNTNAIGGAI